MWVFILYFHRVVGIEHTQLLCTHNVAAGLPRSVRYRKPPTVRASTRYLLIRCKNTHRQFSTQPPTSSTRFDDAVRCDGAHFYGNRSEREITCECRTRARAVSRRCICGLVGGIGGNVKEMCAMVCGGAEMPTTQSISPFIHAAGGQSAKDVEYAVIICICMNEPGRNDARGFCTKRELRTHYFSILSPPASKPPPSNHYH